MSLAMADAEGCGDLVADSVGKCDQEIKLQVIWNHFGQSVDLTLSGLVEA